MTDYRVTYPFKVPHGAKQFRSYEPGNTVTTDDMASWIGEDGKSIGEAKCAELVASGHIVAKVVKVEMVAEVVVVEPKRSRF